MPLHAPGAFSYEERRLSEQLKIFLGVTVFFMNTVLVFTGRLHK